MFNNGSTKERNAVANRKRYDANLKVAEILSDREVIVEYPASFEPTIGDRLTIVGYHETELGGKLVRVPFEKSVVKVVMLVPDSNMAIARTFRTIRGFHYAEMIDLLGRPDRPETLDTNESLLSEKITPEEKLVKVGDDVRFTPPVESDEYV